MPSLQMIIMVAIVNHDLWPPTIHHLHYQAKRTDKYNNKFKYKNITCPRLGSVYLILRTDALPSVGSKGRSDLHPLLPPPSPTPASFSSSIHKISLDLSSNRSSLFTRPKINVTPVTVDHHCNINFCRNLRVFGEGTKRTHDPRQGDHRKI